MPRFAVAFSLSSVGQYLGFAGSNPFVGSMDLFRKKLFLAFRGFDPYRRRDGSVLEGTICKQFVSNAKKPKEFETLSWVQVLPVACVQYLILEKVRFR